MFGVKQVLELSNYGYEKKTLKKPAYVFGLVVK